MYPSMHLAGGLFAWGCLPRGVFIWRGLHRGGVSAWGFCLGVCVCQHALEQTPPPVNRMTGVTRLHSSRMRTAHALTVSPSMLCTGGCTWSWEVYLVPGGCTWSRGGGCTWSGGGECTLPCRNYAADGKHTFSAYTYTRYILTKSNVARRKVNKHSCVFSSWGYQTGLLNCDMKQPMLTYQHFQSFVLLPHLLYPG